MQGETRGTVRGAMVGTSKLKNLLSWRITVRDVKSATRSVKLGRLKIMLVNLTLESFSSLERAAEPFDDGYFEVAKLDGSCYQKG